MSETFTSSAQQHSDPPCLPLARLAIIHKVILTRLQIKKFTNLHNQAKIGYIVQIWEQAPGTWGLSDGGSGGATNFQRCQLRGGGPGAAAGDGMTGSTSADQFHASLSRELAS